MLSVFTGLSGPTMSPVIRLIQAVVALCAIVQFSEGVIAAAQHVEDLGSDRLHHNATFCGDVLDQQGCYTLSQYFKCTSSGPVAAQYAIYATQLEANDLSANTMLIPRAEADGSYFLRAGTGDEKGDFSGLGFGNDTSSETAQLLNMMIPGVWTLEDLLAADKVTTVLGLVLNDHECCHKRFERNRDGQVVVYNGNSTTPEARIVADDTLCAGGRVLWIDSFPAPLPTAVEDSLSYSDLQTDEVTKLTVFNGMARGGCSASASDMFATLDQLVEEHAEIGDYMRRIDPAFLDADGNGTLSSASSEISVTWFVARQNSMSCFIRPRESISGFDLDDGALPAGSIEECCAMCRKRKGCNSYVFTEASQECALKTVPQQNMPVPTPGSDLGFVGLNAEGYNNSRFILHHMLSGSYCEDDLLSAGSVNTMLGEAIGAELPLLFSKDANGQFLVTTSSAISCPRTFPPIKKTMTVLQNFSSCRSMIYILSDDYFPPKWTNASIVPDLDMTWDYLADETRQYHDAVYEDTCWNPLRVTNETLVVTNVGGSSNYYECCGPEGLSAGVITAIVVGSCASVLLLLGAAVLVIVVRRRRMSKDQLQTDSKAHSGSKSSGSSGFKSWTFVNSFAKSDSTVESLSVKSEKLTSESGSSRDMSKVGSEKETALSDYMNTVPRDLVVKDVKVGKKVGSGSFGSVFMGKWHSCHVAVKTFTPEAMDEEEAVKWKDQFAALQKEVSIMSGLRHPNVVQFLGVMSSPASVVMEFCHRGSLHSVLRQAASDGKVKKQLDWKRRILMAIDAAKGMQFLHNRDEPIIHRDLKSPNLLVDKSWNVKVSDFGLSKIVDMATAKTSIAVFNPRWLAPELHMTMNTSPTRSTMASDVYSFGIVLWELLTLEEPFKDMVLAQIIFGVVQNGLRPEIPSLDELKERYQGVESYVSLMQRCWAQDASQRPDFDAVVKELGSILLTVLEKRRSATTVSRAAEGNSRAGSATTNPSSICSTDKQSSEDGLSRSSGSAGSCSGHESTESSQPNMTA